MASEILIVLVTKLYEVVQTVRGNKERCKEISQRAQRLLPAFERVISGEQEVSNIYLEAIIYYCSLTAATPLNVNVQIRRVCYHFTAPGHHPRNCAGSVT